jgi:hypothetical protein
MFGDPIRLTIAQLAKNRLFMKLLRWDVTPEVLFKPRFVDKPEDARLHNETEGYMFYVDWFKGRGEPRLMVMKTMGLTSNSFAEVTDCPKDLLRNAAQREGVKSYTDMYPIDEALEKWLKEKLAAAANAATV